jgi:hypothetical protein
MVITYLGYGSARAFPEVCLSAIMIVPNVVAAILVYYGTTTSWAQVEMVMDYY